MGRRECGWRLKAIATDMHIAELKRLIKAGDEHVTAQAVRATRLPIRIEPDILSIDRISAHVQAAVIAGEPYEFVVLNPRG